MAKRRERKTATSRAASPLGAFVGRWSTRGRTTDGTDVEIRCADDYAWLPGERFVVHRWSGRVGRAAVHGLEVLGAGDRRGEFRTHFFDGEGHEGSERLTRRGRTWTWLGRRVMGVAWHRCRATASRDGRVWKAVHERSTDARRWTPWMVVTLTRKGRVPTPRRR
jgi:hypothetical protein